MTNKRALITGASSGIGYQMALILAKRGFDLILVARRADRLQELKDQIVTQYSRSVQIIAQDLTDPNAPARIFNEVMTAQNTAVAAPVTVLINNAGGGKYRYFKDQDAKDFQQEIQLNISALTLMTHTFLPSMLEHSQAGLDCYIGNVGSIASYMPAPRFAVYASTKHFVRVFSQILGYELKNTRVSVSCICPGGTATEFLENAGQKMTEQGSLFMMSSKHVAELGLNGLFAKKPVVTTGFINQLTVFLSQILPFWLTIRLVAFSMNQAVNATHEVTSTKK